MKNMNKQVFFLNKVDVTSKTFLNLAKKTEQTPKYASSDKK